MVELFAAIWWNVSNVNLLAFQPSMLQLWPLMRMGWVGGDLVEHEGFKDLVAVVKATLWKSLSFFFCSSTILRCSEMRKSGSCAFWNRSRFCSHMQIYTEGCGSEVSKNMPVRFFFAITLHGSYQIFLCFSVKWYFPLVTHPSSGVLKLISK